MLATYLAILPFSMNILLGSPGGGRRFIRIPVKVKHILDTSNKGLSIGITELPKLKYENWDLVCYSDGDYAEDTEPCKENVSG